MSRDGRRQLTSTSRLGISSPDYKIHGKGSVRDLVLSEMLSESEVLQMASQTHNFYARAHNVGNKLYTIRLMQVSGI